MPFDFNITTQKGLLDAIESNGQSLFNKEEDMTSYTMTVEGQQGLTSNGIYYWHDYEFMEDKRRLSPSWNERLPLVNAKYQSLWSRFAAVLREQRIPKTLYLSNSQYNLQQFCLELCMDGDIWASRRFLLQTDGRTWLVRLLQLFDHFFKSRPFGGDRYTRTNKCSSL